MKKGFTLVELLAVIVILGIILVIAVPSVLGIINQSREDAYMEVRNRLIDAKDQYLVHYRNEIEWNNDTATITISMLQEAGLVSQPLEDPIGGNIEDVEFVVQRYSDGIRTLSILWDDGSIEIDFGDHVIAGDEDFEWRTDSPWSGAWHYVGSDTHVMIPNTINGEELTSYRAMFRYTNVESVISFNNNIVDMSYIFQGSQAPTLNLSNFDTSNVWTMERMFWGSEATSLDLSSFDTSNVENMSFMFPWSQATTLDLSSFDTSNVWTMERMFYGSQATSLDLSSFDTSNVSNMDLMFFYSQATTGYARTQADANNLNNPNTMKPAHLEFTVGP